jgi:hypothetical protein
MSLPASTGRRPANRRSHAGPHSRLKIVVSRFDSESRHSAFSRHCHWGPVGAPVGALRSWTQSRGPGLGTVVAGSRRRDVRELGRFQRLPRLHSGSLQPRRASSADRPLSGAIAGPKGGMTPAGWEPLRAELDRSVQAVTAYETAVQTTDIGVPYDHASARDIHADADHNAGAERARVQGLHAGLRSFQAARARITRSFAASDPSHTGDPIG